MEANYFLWAAAVLSVITFYVHTFIGGPVVAKPLLECEEISKASKWLNYYCWHNTTILIVALALAFSYSAYFQVGIELVIFSTGLSGALSLLSAFVAIKGRINPFRFPSTSLFAGICILGGVSLALM